MKTHHLLATAEIASLRCRVSIGARTARPRDLSVFGDRSLERLAGLSLRADKLSALQRHAPPKKRTVRCLKSRLVTCVELLGMLLLFQSVPASAAAFAEGIVAYDPGLGFATEFGSGLGYTNPGVALGPPNPDTAFGAVTPFNPPFSRDEIVSLGTNGSLVVSFGTPILNDPSHPFGLDFIIYGSTGFIDSDFPNGHTDPSASVFGNNPGMTRVSVSAGDGIFYTLNPFFAPTVDGFFPTDGAGTFGLPVNPALQPADFADRSLAAIRALYAGSAGGAGYDLSWALDANGQPVNLSSISLVRIDVLSGRAEIDGFAAVPEPATWVLAGWSALLMLWWKRGRNHQD